MRRGAALLMALALGPVMALAAPTGTPTPPLAAPNRVLDAAGGKVAVAVALPPQGFAEALRAADRDGVIAAIHDLQAVDREIVMGRTQVLVLFVQDWDDALHLADSIGSDLLRGRYEKAADDVAADIFEVRNKDGRVILFTTFAAGLAPYEIPAVCYARLVATLIYADGKAGDFRMRSCAESIQ